MISVATDTAAQITLGGLGVSHRPLFRGVALFHNAERGGSPMRIAADCGQHLLVGPQGFDVLSVRRTHCVVKRLGRGELTEHSRHQRSARKVIGPVLGVPTRAVRLVGPRMQ